MDHYRTLATCFARRMLLVFPALLPVFLLASPAPGEEVNPLRLLVESAAYLEAGDTEKALSRIETALGICERTGDLHTKAFSLFLLGNVKSEEKKSDDALQAYRRSAQIFEQLEDPLGMWLVKGFLGEAYYHAGRLDDAANSFRQALDSFHRIGASATETSSKTAAMFMLIHGVPPELLSLAGSDLLRFFRSGFTDSAEAFLLEWIALVERDRQQYEKAISTFEEALKTTRDAGMSNEILGELARTRQLMGRLDEATADYEKALVMAESSSNRALEMQLLQQLAEIDDAQGRKEPALTRLKRSLKIARELVDQRTAAMVLTRIANIYSSLGLLEPAESHAREALTIARKIGDSGLEGGTEFLLGTIFLRVNHPQEAGESFARALSASPQVNHPIWEDLIVGLAATEVDAEWSRPEDVLSSLHRMLTWARESGMVRVEILAHELLGIYYLERGREVEAIAELEAALKVPNVNGDDTLRSIADLLASLLQRENPDVITQMLEKTIKPLELDLAKIGTEELVTAFHSSELLPPYLITIYMNAQQGRIGAAFEDAEKARSRAFLQQLGNHPIDLRRNTNDELVKKEVSLRRRMRALEEELEEARRRGVVAEPSPSIDRLWQDLQGVRRTYKNLLLELKESHPEYLSLVSVETLDLSQVQAEIPENTSLIAYFAPREAPMALAWVVDRSEARMTFLAFSGSELRERVEYLNNMIRSRDFDLEAAGDLYRGLIAPLELYVRHRNLILIPHGVLHYLPFAALWNPEKQRFLVEDYALTHAPSASVLHYLAAKQTPNRGRPLILANPDGSLRHAEAEGETIARLYGTRPLLRTEATESRLHAMAGEIDVLHIAAHGVYDAGNPLFSRLQLAAGGGFDGNLEVHEIFGLDLRGTNLVVLSACETALGEHTEGDEIVGMARAFLYAGSPAVVTSLWPVDDAASAAFMESFYRRLRQTSGIAEALRQAQLEVMANDHWRSPYFWAAFTLTGDAQWNTTEP